MAEQLFKLSPDRDLQCYFYMPSAIAALSNASPTGFTLSGTWRQQFDWAVVEWSRDNVFEHPALRYLPDGDLSGLTLTYQETRTNCIPLDSDLFPTVDWPSLRIWANDPKDPNGVEQIYKVPLKSFATPVKAGLPATYSVTIDFGSLSYTDAKGHQQKIPTTDVRKLRWTWAADLQQASYVRSEFSVIVSNWTVSGTGRQYLVAGPGSRRIEDDNPSLAYSPAALNGDSTTGWVLQGPGNYSGSTIHLSSLPGSSFVVSYSEPQIHQLFLSTRKLSSGASFSVAVDGQAQQLSCLLLGEDVLVRIPLGTFATGTHSITVTHTGNSGEALYFDFLEIAYPTADLPEFPISSQLTLATDWDTYHSQSLPAERTAWIIQKLGFHGRVNHYVGALWFYELTLPGHVYETATLTLPTTLQFPGNTILTINGSDVVYPNQQDDTAVSVASNLANLLKRTSTQVWAAAVGNQLTVTARRITPNYAQTAADQITFKSKVGVVSSPVLTGGIPGTPYTPQSLDDQLFPITNYWRTDLTAGLNRAAQDWSQAFYRALKGYGIDVVAAFSTEMMNADPGPATGIAQCRIDNSPVIVNTPAVMTNFSPASLAFWKQVYFQMADLQAAAGMTPYLQSGEVQWWYYPYNQIGEPSVSMPFYDAYTQQQFQAEFGVPMPTIVSKSDTTTLNFLANLIGHFTAAIRASLQAKYPKCRYEILFPTDTNDPNTNPVAYGANFASSDWTPQNVSCLKTESFIYTGERSLDNSLYSMGFSAAKGFPASQRSHLIGIGDATSSWLKETNYAQGEQLESVVLFALDQYCLIGYPVPPAVRSSRSSRQA